MDRHRNVTIVAIFYWLNSLALAAIGFVALLPLISPSSQMSKETRGFLLLGSLLTGIIVIAIFSAVVGWGLWQLKGWARRAAIVTSSLVIVANLIVFVMGFMNGQLSIPYGIVLHGLVIWTLNSVSVKSTFEAGARDEGLDIKQDKNLESKIICPNCGNAGLPTDRFCRKCGNQLKTARLS